MNKFDIDRCCSDYRTNIPWLVNGTLHEPEVTALREHLRSCVDCQADFELHSEMRASVLGRELTPMKPATRADDIIAVDERIPGQQAGVPQRTSRMIAIAASVAIFGVALAVALYPRGSTEPVNQIFETAISTNPSDGIDYVLELQFEESVDISERARIAAELDGAIKWAVDDAGIYEVHVRLTEPTLVTLREYEERTDALTGVQSAKFTALQLPMR